MAYDNNSNNNMSFSVVMVIDNITALNETTAPWRPSPGLVHFRKFIRGMDLYFVPPIILIGLIGNCLSFLVFVTSHLRRQSSSVYLAALAVSDTGVLVCVFLNWSTNIGFNLVHMEGWCQSTVYFLYVWCFLSVWFVVGFTAERYIAVCHPLQRQKLCTTRNAKIVVTSLGVFAVILHLYATWTSSSRPYGKCFPLMAQYGQLITIMNMLDTALTFLLPSVAIIVLNILIVHAVIQVKKQRRRLSIHQLVRPINSLQSSVSASSAASTSKKWFTPKHLANSSQIKVTKMLVVVSSTFLLLNLPGHSIRFYVFVASLTKHPVRRDTATYIAFFQYIYYINFSVNFFLYNACGRNFRRVLGHMCSKVRYKVIRVFARGSSADFDNIPLENAPVENARLTVAIHSKSSRRSSKSSKTISKRSSQDEKEMV